MAVEAIHSRHLPPEQGSTPAPTAPAPPHENGHAHNLDQNTNGHVAEEPLPNGHQGDQSINGELSSSKELRVTYPSAWEIRVEGYDPDQEEQWRKRFTLSNGILTVVPRVDRSGPITKQRGLFEQKPEEDGDKQSSVPGGLNLPDITDFAVRFGETELRKDLSTLARTFNLRYHTLTTSYTAYDADGRAVDVTIDEFASLSDPHLFVRKLSFMPHYTDEVSIRLGINSHVENNGHEFYGRRKAQGLEDHFGIVYSTDTKYKGHQIAIAQKADVFDDKGQRMDLHPDSKRILKDKGEDPRIIHHQVTLPARAGETISVFDITSVHSDVDKKRLEGHGDDPVVESKREIDLLRDGDRDYDVLLTDHKAEREKRWKKNEIYIDGDEDLQRVLRFNQSHVMTEVPVGYAWAGPAAKIGNAAFIDYADKGFWEGDIWGIFGLTPEQFATLMEYRVNLLPASREKARRYFTKAQENQALDWQFQKGGFWPWEAHFPTKDGENGEGCPEWVRNELGRRVPIESLEEEIHISGDVALAAMNRYLMTGDEEFRRNQGAEIVLEAARFYASRAVYNKERDRYEYWGVTGPDEYHPHVNNNGYTHVIAKFTLGEGLRLLQTGMVSDELKEKIGLEEDEIEEMKKREAKIYIPFDPKTKILSQFDGYDDLEYINLDSDAYRGVTTMDVKLRGERTPVDKPDEELTADERNPVRATKVLKQHDSTLILDLLGEEFLQLLPEESLRELRASDKTDEEIMDEIYAANYNKYFPMTCDGSSLSPNEGAQVALNAGVHPDNVYAKFKRAATIDWHDGDNTHKTERGLHFGALVQSVSVARRGFGGIRATREALVINPRLPSHWRGFRDTWYYRGQRYKVDVDRASNEIAVTLVDPSEDASVPVSIRGNRIVLDAKNNRYVLPLEEASHKNGSIDESTNGSDHEHSHKEHSINGNRHSNGHVVFDRSQYTPVATA